MHPDVVDMANTVQQSIHNTVNQILHYLSSSWKKKYRPLWKLQRVCVMYTVWLVVFMGLIFRGLWNSDDFMGLYFCGVPTLIA